MTSPKHSGKMKKKGYATPETTTLIERDPMPRVDAARAWLTGRNQNPDSELEAFMAIFHPEKAANRELMADLKRATRPEYRR